MYPTWLTNLFINNTCPECRGPATLDDIIAIGARRPEPFEAHLREALAMILVSCRHCGQCINFSTRCSRDGLIDAVRELAAVIESAPASDAPLFGAGAPPCQSQSGGGATDAGEPKVRPSIRADQATHPPTEAEIKEFLARLKRMSFRSGSKGFGKLSGEES